MAGRLLTYLRQHKMPDGEETIPRWLAATSVTCTSGTLRLTYFTAQDTRTVTKASMHTGSTAAAATPTLVRFGLYEIDADGDGELVASTASDTSVFASANTMYTRDFSDEYVLREAQRYAFGFLIVTEEDPPTILGATQSAFLNALAPRITGTLSGQSDLPSSITDTLTGLAGAYWGRVWA